MMLSYLPRQLPPAPSSDRGIVSDVKTKYSNAGIPLDPALAEVLQNWRRKTLFKNPEDWVFASLYVAGRKPWDPWELNGVISSPQAFVAVSDVSAGIRSGTPLGHSLMRQELR
jgi:integrase